MKNIFLKIIFSGLSISLFLLMLSSCENDDINQKKKNSTANYFPLSIGNYWVYDIYYTNKDENETLYMTNDSVIVVGDSIINGKRYFILEGNYFQSWNKKTSSLLREGNDCILEYNYFNQPLCEDTILSYNNFTDIISEKIYDNNIHIFISGVSQDTLYTSSCKMEKTGLVVVPAGQFEAINAQEKIYINEKYANTNIPNPRYLDNYYADGVGRLTKTVTYLNSLTKYEWRLKEYHINP